MCLKKYFVLFVRYPKPQFMKYVLAIALLCVAGNVSFAQKAPFKFGEISLEDLKMTRYEKDTSAAAVILGDYGISTFLYTQSTGRFSLTFQRTQQIKILKKEGYSQADFEILLYQNGSSEEKLSGLKVVTHNLENGKDVQTRIKSDAVFDEAYDQNINLKKFTAPNVKEGSVIEVTYEITSPFIQYLRDWEFQSTIPTVWSEYRVNIPEYFNYQQFMQGYIGLNVNEQKLTTRTITLTDKERTQNGLVAKTTYSSDNITYNDNVFRWAAQEVPAFKEEPYMTTSSDYIAKINFELVSIQWPNKPVQSIMGTWADLNKSFIDNENFGGVVKGSMFLKKQTEDVTANAKTQPEKLTAIYNFVKSSMEWNGSYRKYVTSNFKKPLEEKKGNSAEINLLLVAMLQRAGLPANPVLISTRNNGFIRENMALSSQFNYVICQAVVDGKTILLDATDRMLPMNLLPERCLNGRGYIISEDSPGWIDISAPKSKIFTNAELNFLPTGEVSGKINITNDTYDGYSFRRAFFKKGEADYVKDFSQSHDWEIEKSSFQNLKEIHEAAKEQYESRHAESLGDESILYINPLIHLRITENPFRLEDRVYPVDFGRAIERVYVCRINIPENFSVDELPKPKMILLPNNSAKFTYNVQPIGNAINVTTILSINQSLFTQLEYKSLREFYDLIVAKHAEQIVLKKKL